MLKACLILWISFFMVSCTSKKPPLGTAKNPIKIFFVPSVDAKMLADNSNILKSFLEKNTPYRYQISVPQSFIAVVEAFGTKRADVASMNTFGYILAHQKYGAQAKLTLIRHGESTYRSQFIVKADSPYKKLEDLAGKKIAYVDPASMSGYLLPLHSMKQRGVKAKDMVFSMKHDNVVTMVYTGQVDAGATFYSPPFKDTEGKLSIEDARRLVKTQYPDIEEKVRILELTGEIPNDPIVFRAGLPEEMKQVVIEAMGKFIETDEGKMTFVNMYGANGFKVASDDDYKGIKEMLASLGMDLQKIMGGK